MLTSQITTKPQRHECTSSNRLFLSNLNDDLPPEELRRRLVALFGTYGPIQEVFLSSLSKKRRRRKQQQQQQQASAKKHRSFGFVVLETVEQAQQALQEQLALLVASNDNHPRLFGDIEPATGQDGQRRTVEQQAKRRQEQEKEQTCRAKRLALMQHSGCNLLVHVFTSHLDRVKDWLLQQPQEQESQPNGACTIIIIETISQSTAVTLLVLQATNPTAFRATLYDTWYLTPVLIRVTVLDNPPVVVQGNIHQALVPALGQAMETAYNTNKKELSNDFKMVVRMAIFPPKLQDQVLEAVADYQDDHKLNPNIILAATNVTHVLSAVQVYTNNDNDKDTADIYVLGKVEDADQVVRLGIRSTDRSSNVSRAYYKLREAWERYQYSLPTTTTTTNQQYIALDCGAAPGGWTKFLFETLLDKCRRIYAVDPAALAAEVLQLNADSSPRQQVIRHVTSTIQVALPHLKEELQAQEEGGGGQFVNIWVSDMCCKDLERQVDYFLQARSLGVVASGTFFVLTIKCTVGRSKAFLDQLVQSQVDRLCLPPVNDNNAAAIARDVQVLHLFANRHSERTIMGYLI